MRKWLARGVIGLGLAVALIQLIPYGRRQVNPPVSAEPPWSTAEVRALSVRACFDCHSNETRWPWYAEVAPMSWLVQHDVDEGRQALNFSEWNHEQPEAKEAAQSVRDGAMPPLPYWLLHREAHLSARERERLIDGLTATFGSEDEVSWQNAPASHDRRER